MRCIASMLLFVVMLAGAPSALPAAEGILLPREEVCLNGVWDFAPARDRTPPTAGWGTIQVPGTWQDLPDWWRGYRTKLGGILQKPQEPVAKDCASGWYQRVLDIPAQWRGRAVELELTRVSTDAVVFVNGKSCGEIHWPFGTVDLTPNLNFGEQNRLQILVFAALTQTEVTVYMGSDAGQQYKSKATLDSRGITGEVFLRTRPAEGRLNGVFIQSSVRKKALTLDVEIGNVTTAGETHFTANLLDGFGHVEKSFEKTLALEAKPEQTVRLEFAWDNPRLWEVGDGQLYTLQLTAAGAPLKDSVRETFGFRECWIEGRKVMLNGHELRLRPILWSEDTGSPATMDHIIQSAQRVGWNLAWLWPWDVLKRGTVNWHGLWYISADRQGMPINGRLPIYNDLISNGGGAVTPGSEQRNAYLNMVRKHWKKWRNHPSILVWTMSSNAFGFSQDQNPWLLGRDSFRVDDVTQAQTELARGLMSEVKKLDETRPIMNHQAGLASDVHTVNGYLNWMPLQEREEYLSAWATDADRPFMVVEGGTPLDMSFFRNRTGCNEVYSSEPLFTEFGAAYLGRASYAMEPPFYRAAIRDSLAPNQPKDEPNPHSAVNAHNQVYRDVRKLAKTLPVYHEIQNVFVPNTSRSWRTMGGALMLPWGFHLDAPESMYSPATGRGFSSGLEPDREWFSYDRSSRTFGAVIAENSRPSLAWICAQPQANNPGAFTDKAHNFFAGSEVRKAVALLNDHRQPQEYSLTISAFVDGQSVMPTFEKKGTLAVSATEFVPFQFALPQSKTTKGAAGEIVLIARIGDATWKDRFSFRVFPAAQVAEKNRKQFCVLDPIGKTSEMVRAFGVEAVNWQPEAEANQGKTLLIGREYLDRNNRLPVELEAFVKSGGTAILFAQKQQQLMNVFNFRICGNLPRRVFAVNPRHPVMSGLIDEDLRDWAGSDTLAAQRTDKDIPFRGSPAHAWHWGNRGALSSAAMEKPHHSGLRPLLECEFDLAYSPLMELDYGAGCIILCTLSFEDNYRVDAAAARLCANLLDYVSEIKPRPLPGKTVYLGGPDGSKLLTGMGLRFTSAAKLEGGESLVVVGADVTPDLTGYIKQGGRVLYLGRKQNALLGLTLLNQESRGCLSIPGWPELAGLSSSDTRLRVNLNWPVLGGSSEVAGDGLFARHAEGKGVALCAQLDPAWLNADQQTYNRYTRWRQTRALAQILANLGGSFENDGRIFTPRRDEYNIAGEWLCKIVTQAPVPFASWHTQIKNPLTYNHDELKTPAFTMVDGDTTGWSPVTVPGGFARLVPAGQPQNGIAMFRKVIDVPAEWAGKPLSVNLDVCMCVVTDVAWDGKKITRPQELNWAFPQNGFAVPGELVTPGKHLIAVVLNGFWADSSLGKTATEMRVLLQPQVEQPAGWYHPDYRRDHAYGDDPYRYVRW